MRTTARTRPARLAAAALGAGILLTGIGAAPALAQETAPAASTSTAAAWTPEHGMLSGHVTPLWTEDGFLTMASVDAHWNVDASDLKIELFSTADPSVRVEVPFTFDAELSEGRLDMAATRPMLGAAASDPVTYVLSVKGEEVATLQLGADAQPGDDQLAEITGGGGVQVLTFSQMPESFTRTMLTTADEPYARVGPMRPEDDSQSVLVQEPQHGDLVPVMASWDPSVVDRYLYVADAGFTGKDTVVFEYSDGSRTSTETVVVSVGDPRVDEYGPSLDPAYGDYEESMAAVQDFLAQRDGKGTPAPDGEHTVPEKVETGSATAWWLAAAGALGAGALLRLRPARRGA